MKIAATLSIVFALITGTSALADSSEKKEEKKPSGHCEKTTADGEIKDIEAKDKADCKAKGGKWNKGQKDHNHDHK
jgi:hypothetical protein